VQDTGAPTTHDKPGSLTCPVYSIDTREHFSCSGKNLYISPCFSNFSWSEVGSNSQSLARQLSVLPLGQIPWLATYFLPLNVYTAMMLPNLQIRSLSQNVTNNNTPTIVTGCDFYPSTALSHDVAESPATLCHRM